MDSLIAIGSSAALIYGVFAIYQIGIGLGYQDMKRSITILWICILNLPQ
ncbi:MAG: hypothetical protein ACLSCV_04490 [Acutalibacteraceae bacterium]